MNALRGGLSVLPMIVLLSCLLLLTPGLLYGVWSWPTAWGFITVFGVVSGLANALLAAFRPASFRVRHQRRAAPQEKGQPLIDALGLPFYLFCILGWLVFIPLDVFQFRLAPPPPAILKVVGVLGVIGGLAVSYLAIAQNRFAAPTIHDQRDQGQQVIQTGLYGTVRHPFYAGVLLVYPGAALWLGSSAAAIACIAFLLMTLARIVVEERYLREHLPGYSEYAQRVRAKLIPGLL